VGLSTAGGNNISRHNSRPDNQAGLDSRLNNRLLAYAALATGVAAMSSHARAEVVYTPVQANLDLDYYLDLNNDGINDFRIHSYYLSDFADLEVFPLNGSKNKVVMSQYIGRTWAAAMPPGGE
jgi:hypothetical protein